MKQVCAEQKSHAVELSEEANVLDSGFGKDVQAHRSEAIAHIAQMPVHNPDRVEILELSGSEQEADTREGLENGQTVKMPQHGLEVEEQEQVPAVRMPTIEP